MTRKQIEQARELRLWIGQVVVPAAMTAVTLLTVPEVRQTIATAANGVKESIEKKFKKN